MKKHKHLPYLENAILTIIALIVLLNSVTGGSNGLLEDGIEDCLRQITFVSTSDIEIPTEEEILFIEQEYIELCSYLKETKLPYDEIEMSYNEVLNSKVCSIANYNFNQLAELYAQYKEEIAEIKSRIDLCEERYDEYLDKLSRVPLWAVIILRNLHKQLEERVWPLYYTVDDEKEKYLHDEEQVDAMYMEAKTIADDFFEDYYPLMCQIVNAESGICTAMEMACVANVIENRIMDRSFPDTLYGVVYQKGQYEPVMSGTIDEVPSDRVKQVVEDYLRGRIQTEMPRNVVYQALFRQGSGVWDRWKTINIFCYK